MCIKHSKSFGIGILALIVWSSVAFADPKEDFEEGQRAIVREDIPEATKSFLKAAEQNYLPAQFQLGYLQYAQDNYEEAFGWFMMAAYQGDAASAYFLGQIYIVGEGVEKNLEKGIYWTKLSAGKNFLLAQDVLIAAYKTGELGLPINLEESKKWEVIAVALRAAEKKELDRQITALKAARKAAKTDADKKAAEVKTEVNKAADAAAEKKVDDADEATAIKSTNKLK